MYFANCDSYFLKIRTFYGYFFFHLYLVFLIFLAILQRINEKYVKKKVGRVNINLEVKSTRQFETFARIAVQHTRTRERLVKGHKRK